MSVRSYFFLLSILFIAEAETAYKIEDDDDKGGHDGADDDYYVNELLFDDYKLRRVFHPFCFFVWREGSVY